MSGIFLGSRIEPALPCFIALLCAVSAAILLRRTARQIAILSIAFTLGVTAGYQAFHSVLPEEGTYTVTGIIAEEIRTGNNDQRKTVLRNAALNGKPVPYGIYWSFYSSDLPDELTPGKKVEITASIYHPSPATNPEGFDFRMQLQAKNVLLGAYGCQALAISNGYTSLYGTSAMVRHTISEKLQQFLGEEAGGYASAMLLGTRELIAEEDRSLFSHLGIAHLLSISGFHTGILAGAILWFLGRTKAGHKAKLVVVSVLLAAYCLLTGLNAPVVRASILVFGTLLGHVLRRKASGLHILSAAAILILLVQPAQLFSAGFQLTFLAVTGLFILTPMWENAYRSRTGKAPGKLASGFIASLAAQLGIMPAQLYWFHELPILGLLLNPFAIMYVSMLILLCWCFVPLLMCPPIASIAAIPLRWLLSAFASVIRLLGDASWYVLWTGKANVWIYAAWFCFILLLGIFKPSRCRTSVITAVICCALLIIGLVPGRNTPPVWTQFDVGDADCGLLEDGSATWLIDTGDDGETVANYLHAKRKGLTGLILTHLHSDHAGGINALLDRGIPIEACYIPWGAEQALIDPGPAELLETLKKSGIPVIILSRGNSLSLPHGQMTAVWPVADNVRPGQDANESSLVLALEMNDTIMLLTGDLDGKYEQYAATPADILKIAHHGSANSTSSDFLRQVSPQLLLLSGSSKREESFLPRSQGLSLIGTGTKGAVTIVFQPEGTFSVRTVQNRNDK